MDAFQPLRIEEASGVADEQEAVAVKLRDGVEASRGYRLRAVANHLAAFQETRDERVFLEALKLRVRVEQRIAVVKPRHVSDVEDAILHSVNPPAAVCVRIRRIAERVSDAPRGVSVVGQLPEFLDAD